MKIFWRIYFVFWLGLCTATAAEFFAFHDNTTPNDIFDYIEIMLWPAGALGLYGFAFEKSIGEAFLWQALLLLCIGIQIISPIIGLAGEWHLLAQMTMPSEMLALLAGWVLLIFPFYIALYQYGWRSPHLWSEK